MTGEASTRVAWGGGGPWRFGALALVLSCASASRSGSRAPRAGGGSRVEESAAAPASTTRAEPAAGLAAREQAVARHVDEHEQELVSFVERTVNQNSGTHHLDGVRAVGEIYADAYRAIGCEVSWVELPPELQRAGHVVARCVGPEARGKRLLLIGHLDTVFEKDSPFQTFQRDGDRARGPGVVDMKGGNAIALYALSALHAQGLLRALHVTVVLTGDEEDPGKPIATTRKVLVDAARHSDVALNFEGMVDGMNTATIARRGFVGWTLKTTGQRAHSSQVFGDEHGFGAVYEAARILDEFRRELSGQAHLTFNPGLFLGGTQVRRPPAAFAGSAEGKRNVIAQSAEVIGDLRAPSPEQAESAQAAMQAIVERHLPGTGAELEFEEGYPPMAPTPDNQALLARYDRVSRDLGLGAIVAVDPDRRGAADVSFVAPLVPALDGIGASGSGAHGEQEQIDLRSLPVATKRAALLIYRLGLEARE